MVAVVARARALDRRVVGTAVAGVLLMRPVRAKKMGRLGEAVDKGCNGRGLPRVVVARGGGQSLAARANYGVRAAQILSGGRGRAR
ncbi:hypothetical protein BS50DRAFT_234960 [Corynespora cassiicola Philippines]|uniref:Uncharacterized protein n=1 Tax=Corynespora cassiicola Philippines TaxID=1448308 RepID=A0A2T2P325_CORCC|nr:hypothetical protein BS50DRAFT_234960 [Corynespora cassiicola Philippines]